MSRPKATLIRASALVPLELESFEEDDTKNLRGKVYQANASIIRAYSLVSLLENGVVESCCVLQCVRNSSEDK